MTLESQPQFDHFSDRELLLLNIQETRYMKESFLAYKQERADACKEHGRQLGLVSDRVKSLENWRTFLAGGYAALAAWFKYGKGGA